MNEQCGLFSLKNFKYTLERSIMYEIIVFQLSADVKLDSRYEYARASLRQDDEDIVPRAFITGLLWEIIRSNFYFNIGPSCICG